MSSGVGGRLKDFTIGLLERRGALVEWPGNADEGWAMLPPELSALFPGHDMLRLSPHAGNGGLGVSLASDFLDRMAPLLDAEPRAGAFMIPEMYLKKSAMDEPVARAFGWLNAKVRVIGAKAGRAEYHVWTFLAGLKSEDTWQDVMVIAINASTGAEVALPDVDSIDGLQPSPQQGPPQPSTFGLAVKRACVHVENRAAAFVGRLESRLERDRKRLRDYYHALLKEHKTARAHDAGGADDGGAGQQAVDLELRRKTLELDERYAIRAALTPLTLVRLDLPVLMVECEVFRKQSRRIHSVCWNPVLTALEPMGCSVCGAGIFSVAFSDDDVRPCCSSCMKLGLRG